MLKYLAISTILFVFSQHLFSQDKSDANIFGDVQSNGAHIPFATISIKGTSMGAVTDKSGHYFITNLPTGEITLVVQMMGYKNQEKTIQLEARKTMEINFQLEEEVMQFDEVVVSGTKTFKRKTESSVIVNVVDVRTMQLVQANTLSEGLCFQPGLRVETDCQTCNYTQIRMNGLPGSYSQILINGRPVINPLLALYGLEQIPANMVDRIEVVRGGGSTLYGSSAIAGSVNVLTKTPKSNSFELSNQVSTVGKDISENYLNTSLAVLNQRRNAGMIIYAGKRNRNALDFNNDNYSEMPSLSLNSFGISTFAEINEKSRLDVNINSIYEYRKGGEIADKPAFLNQQSEERDHDIFSAITEYTFHVNENVDYNLFVSYQNTKRKHFTGILPDDSLAMINYKLNPPYGFSLSNTINGGGQLNYAASFFNNDRNVFTIGSEYTIDEINDKIEAYNYSIQQSSAALGIFLQSDWKLSPKLTLLSGVRGDYHNFIKGLVFNPRFSVLYRPIRGLQIRSSFATGYRAPQAFDSDIHIAMSGGGIQKISINPFLKTERSKSLSSSINYDKATHSYIYGFTLEGFYTRLNEVFVYNESDPDSFGHSVLLKTNGGFLIVKGITLELRANYNKLMQIETGVTIQEGYYDAPVSWSNQIPGTNKFLRSPNQYAYATYTYTPKIPLQIALSGVLTGSMLVPHYGGAIGVPDDKLVISKNFFDLGCKISYRFKFINHSLEFEPALGAYNLFNQYQNDFDLGKYRDSNYIYGSSRPRTFYFSLRFFYL